MKKILYLITACTLSLAVFSCGNRKAAEYTGPAYSVVEAAQVDLADFPIDKDGYTVLFDGTSLKGWRTYGRDTLSSQWLIEDGCLKFAGATGRRRGGEGLDIVFAHKFKEFDLELEWKISERGNSGIFILAQEVVTPREDGSEQYEPIYISAPEYQVLDNANHPDAQLGVDGNRQSASLYDMIPAVPQNQHPFGEWNKAGISVHNGTITHYQNGVKVLEYKMWSPEWTALLQASKFSEEAWPLAFQLLNNCGGDAREGYIGFQDHGDPVWFRNIRIKITK